MNDEYSYLSSTFRQCCLFLRYKTILKNSTQYRDPEEGSIIPKYRLLCIAEMSGKNQIELKFIIFILVFGSRRCAGEIILILITQLYFSIGDFICLNPAKEKNVVFRFKRNQCSYQLLQRLAKTPHAFSCMHMQIDLKGLPEPEL